MSCAICYNDFTEVITCPSCPEQFCDQCFKSYLLTKELVVCCPACDKPWTDDFVDNSSDDDFRNGSLRTHRSKILVDQEAARLPELQERARLYKIALSKKRPGWPYYVREMVASYGLPIRDKSFVHIKSRCSWCKNHDTLCTLGQDAEHYATLSEAATALYGPDWSQKDAAPPKKKVVMRPCPAKCRGFVDTEGRCALCQHQFCLRCHEELDGAGHACNPETIETVQLLARETKPCPNCLTNIYKIDGCDQMWCTVCQTPFSWMTGKKEEGRVHNPHYYEWLRRTKGSVPREPTDDPCREGQLRYLYWADLKLDDVREERIEDATHLITGFHQLISEEIQYNRAPAPPNEEALNRMGIAYLAGAISKEEWARRVYIEKRSQKRVHAVYEIRRAFAAAATDLMNSLLTKATAFVPTMKALADLIVYMQDAIDRTYERYFYTGKGAVSLIPNWRKMVDSNYPNLTFIGNLCGRTITNFMDIDAEAFTKFVDWVLEPIPAT
jgi:hypothetical protein